MGMHVIGANTWFRQQQAQGPGIAHPRPDEAAGLEESPEGVIGLTASISTYYPHHEWPRPHYNIPMPIIETAENNNKQWPEPEVETNLRCCDKQYASGSALEEETYLLAQDVTIESSNPILDIGSEAHVSSSASWNNIQSKVLSMPPEICKIIMEKLFEDTFGPREVHPKTDAPVTEMFLSLDKHLYRKYSQTYWSQNSWVIGNGAANDSMRFMTMPPYDTSTTEFSRQVPNNAALKIRRIELHFTKEDLPSPLHQRPITRQSPHSTAAESQSIHSFDSFEAYRSECKIVASQLKQIWQDKFDRVAFLELNRFRLDVTRAYAPDGVFLGVDAVRRLLPFVYGMPGRFEVLAPTKVLEGEVRKAFDVVNHAV